MTTDALDREITIDRDRLDELTLEFNRRHLNKSFQAVAVSGAALGVGGAILGAGAVQAQLAGGAAGAAAEGAKASIAAGVTNAIDMITAIDGIGLAAFGVALAPMGFMVGYAACAEHGS